MIKDWKNKDYETYIKFLWKKHGKVEGDYFTNEEKLTKNTKIPRGKDGLYIHHIDEDKAIMLSTPAYIKKFGYPFDFQKAERLVYCDLMEHMVLHMMIVKKDIETKGKNRFHKQFLVGSGGIFNFMLPELLDIYSGIEYKQPWKQEVIKQVIDKKDELIEVIKQLKKLGYNDEFIFRNKSFMPNIKIWPRDNNDKLVEELKEITA